MHKHTASKSTLFLMEMMIVILMFALCASVCLGLFGASQRASKESDALNCAVIVARTAASCYKASDGELGTMLQMMDIPATIEENATSVNVYYDKQWEPVDKASSDGFCLQVNTTSEVGASLKEAKIAVYDGNQTQIFGLQVKKSAPYAGGDVLHE